MAKKIIWLLLVFSFTYGFCKAQHKITFITEQDGLPARNVFGICKDDDGLIYFTNKSGLFRYNGFQTEVFKHFLDTLKNNFTVQCIGEPLKFKQEIIVQTNNAVYGINFKTKAIKKISITNIKNSNYVTMLSHESGVYFINTYDGSLFLYDGFSTKKITLINYNWKKEFATNLLMISINNTQMAFIFPFNVIVLNTQTNKQQLKKYNTKESTSLISCKANDSILIIGNTNFISAYNINTFNKVANYNALENIKTAYCAKFFDGQFFISTAAGEFFTFYNNMLIKKENLNLASNSFLRFTNTIYAEDSNNLWLNTNGGIIKKEKVNTYFKAYELPQKKGEFNLITTRAIFKNNNDIRISTYNYEYTCTNNLEKISILNTAPYGMSAVQKINQTLYGTLLNGGLINLSKNSKPLINNDAVKQSCIGFITLNNKELLIGGLKLFKYNIATKNLTNIDSQGLSAYKNIQFVAKGKSKIYIAQEGQLSVYNHNLNLLKRINKNIGSIKDVIEISDSTVALGTYGNGVQIVNTITKSVKEYNKESGLNNNNAYCLLMDTTYKIWAGTEEGLSQIDLFTNRIINFNTYNGLLNNEFNSFSKLKDSNTFYMGCMNSIIKFNPYTINSKNEQPKLIFCGYKINDKKNNTIENWFIPQNGLHLKNDIDYTDFYFTLNTLANKKIKFQYTFDFMNGKWLSTEEKNIIRLYNLPAGKHQLKVRGLNEQGTLCANEITIPIEMEQPFYLSWKFYALLVLLTLLAIYYIYTNRIKRLQAVNEVRNKIAMDLHDDVGSVLSSISILSQAAQKEIEKNKVEAKNTLGEIGANARDMISNMSDIIWAVNPEHDTVEIMFSRIASLATKVLEAKGVNAYFDWQKQISDLKLSMPARRNILLIVKEATNNIAKYAQAKNAHISLVKKGKKVNLIIKDDGIGFDPLSAKMGNGINNMRQRAQDINGHLNIESSIKKGTTLTLEFTL